MQLGEPSRPREKDVGSLQGEVRKWLWGQQDWLQEVAHRILQNGSIADQEILEFTSLLKTASGKSITAHRGFDELTGAPPLSNELRLVRICNVVGIENLSPRRPLEFGATRLVVIYGHNGSGKSGYTRILKRAAGKQRAAALRTNVFQPRALQRGCQITVSRAGANESFDWNPEGPAIDELRAVDIFDADEATHYLSKESVASYSPPTLMPTLMMFEALAIACDRIKNALQREQDSLVSSLPELPATFAETPAARKYGALNAQTSRTQVAELLAWTTDDGDQLDLLKARLKESDPAAVAKQKRSTKRQGEKIISALNRYAEAYGAPGLESIRLLRTDSVAKRKVAQDAGLLATSKLDGIGSDSWIALWQAAKAYSELPYPGKAFPVTEDEARCVLCHQELAPDAQTRLRDFERFVEGVLAEDAEKADRVYKAALDALPAPKEDDVVRTQCEAAALTRPEFVASMVQFWQEAARIRALLVDEEFEDTARPISDSTEAVLQIQEYCDQLEHQAVQSELDAAGLERPKLEKEKLNLEARLWISQQASAIDIEIARCKASKEFEDWKSAANSRKVSIKAGELAERIITQEYVSRFNSELQRLGAARLKVELIKTRTERGKALHRLQLRGAKQALGIELILSEGERRVVALAAFLADVIDKPGPSPFVFDDPISSLDQTWEEKTATRLVDLSTTRQVIVFTHRLSMLSQFPESATVVHIRHEPWGAGETGEVPLFGKAPDRALNDLKDRRLAQAKKLLKEEGSEAYYPLVKAICSDFRILLERFVETYVLAEIVQRHRREVNTKGKIHNLLKLRTADCDLINELMSKYSRYEHSQSDEAPVDPPDAEELSTDMQRLSEWHLEFKGRVASNSSVR